MNSESPEGSVPSSFPRLARSIVRNFRDYGAYRSIGKIGGFLASPLFHSREYRLYGAFLRSAVLPPADSRFSFSFLHPSDRAAFREIEQMEEWLGGRLGAILLRGGKCLVARDRDIIAGFNLASFQEINIAPVRYRHPLRTGQAYSEQITVSRPYRGIGLGSSLRYELFRALLDCGIRKIYGATDAGNKSNLALSRKVGLKDIADIRYRRALWKEQTTVRRAQLRRNGGSR